MLTYNIIILLFEISQKFNEMVKFEIIKYYNGKIYKNENFMRRSSQL